MMKILQEDAVKMQSGLYSNLSQTVLESSLKHVMVSCFKNTKHEQLYSDGAEIGGI